MSAEQVQAAMVNLIRYPEMNRGTQLDAFLQQYDLSASEVWKVRSLATSYYVAKYGRDQRSARFDISIKGTLPVSVKVAGARKMARDIYGGKFEPFHENMPVAEISRAFAKFFLENSEKLCQEFELPAFLPDLVRFEMTEHFIRGPLAVPAWKVPAGSLLRPDAPNAVIKLQYDIQPFLEKARIVKDEEVKTMSPEKKAVIVFFARVPKAQQEDIFRLHQFEIDDELALFLELEQKDDPGRDRKLPPCFADLVDLGICRTMT